MLKIKKASVNHRYLNNILIKSSVLFILLILPLFTCLLGCGASSDASSTDVLLAMLASIDGRYPAGDIYALPHASGGASLPQNVGPPHIRTATPELLQAAFGMPDDNDKNKPIPELSSDILTDGALFFSTTAHPFECMVFRCISRSDTDVVAERLLCRMEALRQQYKGSDEQAVIENGGVRVIGKYVIFIVAEQSESMIDAVNDFISR
jgi:hypothetical protein